ncbi:MAG TPA: hypothetical protein VK983_03630 [Candidatus Limnocylindrales bacterium]|nr:hypothetical protein [Candidatus Limnocylindrales bacterium]
MTRFDSENLFPQMIRPRLSGEDLLELVRPVEWNAGDIAIVLPSDVLPQVRSGEVTEDERFLVKNNVTPNEVVAWVKKAIEQ